MLINGRNSVREAVRSHTKINKIYIQKDILGNENNELVEEILSKKYNVQFLSKKSMDAKAEGRHQGFIAEVEDYKYHDLDKTIDEVVARGERLFVVILDGIEDPHNLGSIIRSCECAGVNFVVIDSHDACPVNATAIKVSAGAINHLPIVRVNNLNTAIKKLKERGVWVFGCELGGKSMYDIDMRGDVAIVIGSEGKGIKRLTKELCDDVFTIPMFGKVNSLNASNATAISVYEAVRQRRS